jgi:bifunctional non-homologous end joining protein LigD
MEQSKSKRGDRVFLDTARNAYAQTAVPPYALRARAGAPVATPIEWRELSRSSLHGASYDTQSIFRRLSQKDDPWRDMNRHARALAEPRRKLEALQVDRASS